MMIINFFFSDRKLGLNFRVHICKELGLWILSLIMLKLLWEEIYGQVDQLQ